MMEWNILATAIKRQERYLLRLLSRYGEFRGSGYRDVVMGRVEDNERKIPVCKGKVIYDVMGATYCFIGENYQKIQTMKCMSKQCFLVAVVFILFDGCTTMQTRLMEAADLSHLVINSAAFHSSNE